MLLQTLRKLKQIFHTQPSSSENGPIFTVDRHRVAKQQRAQALTAPEISERLQTFHFLPVFSIIMPVYNPPAEVFRETLDAILNQAYPHWELCLTNDASFTPHVAPILEEYQQSDARVKVTHLPENKGISGASNHALALATGEFICLVDHDDLILHDALFEVAQHLNRWPDADFVYTDSALVDRDGQCVGFFYKPDFNWEMFLCHNWIGQLSTIRRSLVEKVGGWTEGREGQDYDLFLRCIAQARQVCHIPKILYYWRQAPASISVSPHNKPRTQEDQRAVLKNCLERLQIEGTLSDIDHFMFRIHRPLKKNYQVSVIVCPIQFGGDCGQFLDSVLQQFSYPALEVVALMEPGLSRRQAAEKRETLFLAYDYFQTFPANLNQAVDQASGEYLLFVFQAFRVLNRDWVENLMEQAQRPEVGIVAGKLFNAHNRIETAGVILSQQGPLNIFKGEPAAAIGDTNSLISPRSYQLVSGNLAMLARADFSRAGGFDPAYQCNFFDYDLCLRLEQAGLKNLYTPFATLQLQAAHNFYEDSDWQNADFTHFQKTWQDWFGQDGNLNFALQAAGQWKP